MSDGLNNIRSMRIAEIMRDYQQLQQHIVQLPPAPRNRDEARLPGFMLLAQCQAEAHALLSEPFDSAMADADDEITKRQLQRLLIDAASRRFRAQRIAMRGLAATNWRARRAQVLASPHDRHRRKAALAHIDELLKIETAQVTDQDVYAHLRHQDDAKGYWSSEMPSLEILLAYIRTIEQA